MATREKRGLLAAAVTVRATLHRLAELNATQLAACIDDVVRCVLTCATVINSFPEPTRRLLLSAVSERDYRHSVLLAAVKTYVEQDVFGGVRLFRKAILNAPDATTRLEIITQYACAAVWNRLDPMEVFGAIELAEKEV